MNSEEKKWWRTSEVARELGVTDRTVLNWIKRGIIRARRLPSGHFRIPAEEVERLRKAKYKPVVVPQEKQHRKFRSRKQRGVKTQA